jgi:hypothetical protein
LEKGDGGVGADLKVGRFHEGCESFFCFRDGAEGCDGEEIRLISEGDDGWDVRAVAEMKEGDGCGEANSVGWGVSEFFEARD